jgi:hypothetical protein
LAGNTVWVDELSCAIAGAHVAMVVAARKAIQLERIG